MAFSSNSFDGPQRSPHWLRTKDKFSKYQSVRAEYNWNCVSLRIKRWLLLKPVTWISRRKYVSDILRVFPFACHTPIDRMVRRWGHPIVELSWNGLVIHPSPASTNTQIEHTFSCIIPKIRNVLLWMKMGSMGISNMVTTANLCVVIVTFFE